MGRAKVVPKFSPYKIISRAVEEGVAYGVRRAIKYNGDQTLEEAENVVVDQVEQAVMNELAEVMDYGD